MTLSYPNTLDASVDSVQETLHCDVLIIGSGAGGAVTADIMSAAGLSVILVEEGPLKTATDFTMKEKEAYSELYQEFASRQTLDKSIQIMQGRAVGGSTTVNWTSSFRTPEMTLQHWKTHHHVTDLSLKALDPWFDWIEKKLNVHHWEVPPNSNNQLLAKGLEKLGWSHKIIPRNVKGCANLGYCGMGCPINAKQSMLVTCIPAALNQGARLITRARAEKLLRQSDQVIGAEITHLNSLGQVKQLDASKIFAKHVVLSAGAIGTPAILLRSKLDSLNPLIGQRTFLHPVTGTLALMPEAVQAFSGAPQSIYSDEFLWRDGVTGEMGYKLEVPPLHPLISAILLRHHGERHNELMADFPYFQANLALMRDGFHPLSQGGSVSLDDYRYPQLDYPFDSGLWQGLKHAMLTMAEIQFAAGAKSVYPLHMDATPYTSWQQAKTSIETLPQKILRWQIFSAHVMGGCAMGSSEKNSVCDSLGSFHQLEGLSVLDGSLFPTSLGVNPQLTIYAICAKLAANLAHRLGGQLPAELASIKTNPA